MIDVLFDSVLIPALKIGGGILVTGISVLGTLIVKRVAARLKIKMNAEQEESIRMMIRGHAMHTKQTFIKQLKLEKDKDGHLSPEDAAAALGKTMRLSVRALGETGIKTLAKLTGKHINVVVEEVIEEEVGALNLIPKESVKPQGS